MMDLCFEIKKFVISRGIMLLNVEIPCKHGASLLAPIALMAIITLNYRFCYFSGNSDSPQNLQLSSLAFGET